MTQRLKAYIRRTVLESAREYNNGKWRRTKESTQSAFRDAMHGTDTGWWNDLIYTVDVLRMFNRYRSDCAAAIADYLDETGEKTGSLVNPRIDDETTFADMLVACAARKPMTWDDYNSSDRRKQNAAIAATLAIRFAVEWLLHEVASDMEIEL